MRVITITLIILGLSGCGVHYPKFQRPLDELSNDELCQTLGEQNDHGSLVLKIYDELNKRTEKIDNERCFALEKKAKKDQDNKNKPIKLENPLPHINNQQIDKSYINNHYINDLYIKK